MNKFFRTTIVVIVVVVVTALLSAGNVNAQNKSFYEIYQSALEMNHDRFENLNLIQIGDTVLFPAKNGPGVEAWVADKPVNDRHDCIWVLSERYFNGTITTVPADTMRVVMPVPLAPVTNDVDEAGFNPLIWLFYLLLLAFIAFLVVLIYKRGVLFTSKNPNDYPAVGVNLNNMTIEQSLSYLSSHLTDGESISELTRGTLKRFFGPKRIYVNMAFGDKVNRNIYLLPEERVSLVTIVKDGETSQRYYRNACSNGIVSDEFKLPNGWEFRSENTLVNPEAEEINSDIDHKKSEKVSDNLSQANIISQNQKSELSSKKLREITNLVQIALMSGNQNFKINLEADNEKFTLDIAIEGKKFDKKKKKSK